MRTYILIMTLFTLAYAEVPDTRDRQERFLQNLIQYRERLSREGEALFVKRCAYCHGHDGSGQGGFAADLRRRISVASALHTIQNGANNFNRAFPGGMPPMISDRDRALKVADYIAAGMPEAHPGAAVYRQTNCARCHGETGEGRRFLAPNIRRFTQETVKTILRHGKQGKIGFMPPFNYLDEHQMHLLGMYVMSLAQP